MSSHVIIGDNDVEAVIFREYIGVKPYPESLNNFPSDIVNSDIKEFHFILGFAHEIYNEAGKGTGSFNAKWDVGFFDKKKVKDIKDKHPNVKVVISIGGRDGGDVDGAKYPFSPIEKHRWCKHAYDSVKKIIQQLYNGSDANCCHKLIDGIDINYEHINTNRDDFSEYIGDLITRLKDPEDKVIDEVSIAPSHETHEHYMALYRAHRNDINWVNYQFYMQTIPTEADFINRFNDATNGYDPKKLLAGASTDPRDAVNVSQDVFIKSCTTLVSSKSLCGIFIWNANDSANNPNSNEDQPFDLERIAQDILT